VAEPMDPAASSGEVRIQSSAANVEFSVPPANVIAANVTVSTVESAQSTARPVLPVLTQQQVSSASVAVSNVSGVSVASAAVRVGARADRAGVLADLTDQAYDSEVSAYLRDSDSVPSPSAFHYVSPSPPRATSPFASIQADGRQSRAASWVDNVRLAAASQRQLRADSRQSAATLRSRADVHSRTSGRMSTRWQATNPVIELMNKMFDKVAGDAAARRADAAAQRANADRREQQMQVRVDAEFARRDAEMLRREQMVAEKTRLQMELVQLKKDIAAEKRQTAIQLLSPPLAAAQSDMHADSITPSAAGALQPTPGDAHMPISAADSHAHPPPTVDSLNPSTTGTLVQSTAVTRDVHSLALSAPAPAPADTQHATLSAPDSLMTGHPWPLFPSDVVPAPGAINHPHRQLTDSALMLAPALSMTDYALPPTMSDMTAAGPQLGLPRAPLALPIYSSMYAVDVDRALPIIDSSQFSTMTADRRDLTMP